MNVRRVGTELNHLQSGAGGKVTLLLSVVRQDRASDVVYKSKVTAKLGESEIIQNDRYEK